MALPFNSSIPAVHRDKADDCKRAGAAMKLLLEKDLKPRDIMTKAAFENAITTMIAVGGSTNGVLHLLAIARAMEVDLTIDDFQRISNRTPLLCDLRPSGKYVMEDLHEVGGIPGVMRYLLSKGYLNGDCITVTGKTIGENLSTLPDLKPGQDIVQPIEKPIKETGHIRILRGNLAPTGAVAKITGKEGLSFTGPAKVYDCEEDMIKAVEKNQITKGDVIVIRYEGPRVVPACRKCLTPPPPSWGWGWVKTSPSSPMVGFPAARTASSSATSPPKRKKGDRSRCSKMETWSPSMPRRTNCASLLPMRSSPSGRPPGRCPLTSTRAARSTNTSRTSKSASEGCVTDE